VPGTITVKEAADEQCSVAINPRQTAFANRREFVLMVVFLV
jgi:hypothetical protein